VLRAQINCGIGTNKLKSGTFYGLLCIMFLVFFVQFLIVCGIFVVACSVTDFVFCEQTEFYVIFNVYQTANDISPAV